MSIQDPSVRSNSPASKQGDDKFSSSGSEPFPINAVNGVHSAEKRISTVSIPVQAFLLSEEQRAHFRELRGDETLDILDSIGVACDEKLPELSTAIKNFTNGESYYHNNISVKKERLLKKRLKLRDKQSAPLQDRVQRPEKSLSKPGASIDQISTLGKKRCDEIDGIHNEISALRSAQQTKEKDSDKCVRNLQSQNEKIEKDQELEDKVAQSTVSQSEKTLRDHKVWEETANSRITKLESEFSDFASREQNLSRCLPNALGEYADSVKNQICDVVLPIVKEAENKQDNLERSLRQLENGQSEIKTDIHKLERQGKLCRAFAQNTEKRLEELEDFIAAQSKQASNNNPMSKSSTCARQKVPAFENNTMELTCSEEKQRWVRNDKVQLAEMNENPPRRMRTIASANNETNSKIPEKNSEEEQKSRVETLMTTSQNERDAVAVDHEKPIGAISCVNQYADPEKEKKNHKPNDPLILEDGSRGEHLRKSETMRLKFFKSSEDLYAVNRFSRTAGRVHWVPRSKVTKKKAKDLVNAIFSSQEEGENADDEGGSDDENYDGIGRLNFHDLSLSFGFGFLSWLIAFIIRSASAETFERIRPTLTEAMMDLCLILRRKI